MTQNTNKILKGVLAIALILAMAVLIYVYLPRSQENQTPEQTEHPILTVTFSGHSMNYTLKDLEALESFSGNGGYIKNKLLPTVSTSGPFTYTGVNITLLLDQVPNLPSPYSIRVTSIDNYSIPYNWSQIQGNVPIYNKTGNITGSSGVTMLLAYKEQGNYINDTSVGPLRIVYVDDGAFTPSELWTKMVRTITIIVE